MSDDDDEALKTTLRTAQTGFAEMVESIRPALHRYCARMTGSVLDGEDLVQDTLAQAFYGFALLRQDVPLRPWLFTIAHHKCVDFLRSRRVRSAVDLDDGNEPSAETDMAIEDRELASNVFSGLVLALPPKERASVVLKEVLGYSLPEIATILETSTGAVKAALHRAREKLAGWTETPPPPREPPSPAELGYLAAFNRRDWAGLQAQLEDEVHCHLVGRVHLVGREALKANYLSNYAKLPYGWKLVPAEVDGEPVLVCLREHQGQWTPRHAIRIDWRAGRVARIRDYADVPYLFADGRARIDETRITEEPT
jgi:RNA polymerase sigma-70 factor (ECF subfamily)